jgi:hypothetical protein
VLHRESKSGSDEAIQASRPASAGETLGAEKGCFQRKIRGSVYKLHRDTASVRGAEPIKEQNNR